MNTTPSPSSTPPPTIRSAYLTWLPSQDQLWTLLVLTMIGCFIALVPTSAYDFWWHLKVGQLVAQQGIPTTNLFAWTLPPDHPYLYATWLGEWLLYILYLAGGLPGPVFARNMLGLASFSLVAIEAHRRSGSWRLAALAVFLAGAMTINNLTTRTQNWSWVPFGLYTLLLGAYTAGQLRPRALIWLPLIMVFWVNAHGAFVLGLVLIAITAAGETLRSWRHDPKALTAQHLRALYLAGIATLLATLLNPVGPGMFQYVAQLLTDPPSQGLVSEWQPPTTQGIAGKCFFASTLLLLGAFALGRRPSLTDLLLTSAFLWLAWSGQRYVVWYGMLVMPILVQSLARTPSRRPTARRMVLPSTMITLLLLGLLITVQPPWKSRLALPQAYKDLFVDLPGAPELFSNDTPVAATEYLRTHPLPGRLFNDMGYGSYLEWALYPDIQVFIDSRVELYPLQLWQDYIAISDARDHQRLLLETYQIERVMLDRQRQALLAAALADDPLHWEREYTDQRAEIYRRKH